MILHNKIKKIINAIKDSDINEIEISSFWGAQKIRLTKNNTSKVSMSSTNDKSIKEEVIHIQQKWSEGLLKIVETHQKALSWFRTVNPKAYMVLLD